MKKIVKYIFGIIVFFGFMNGVSAEELFRCSYSVNLSGFGGAKDKNTTFELVIGDSAKTTSLSSFDSITGSEDLGGMHITKTPGVVKDLYNKAVEINNCPDISFTFDGNSNINIGLATNFSEKDGVKIAKGSSTSSNIDVSEKKEICTRTKNLRNESNLDVAFTFYEQNGKKYWSASTTNTDNAPAEEATGLISIGEYTFSMTSDFIDKIYLGENTCKNVKTYLKCSNGASERVELTLTKPDDVENQLTIAYQNIILLSDEKNYKAVWSKFVKRIVIGIIVFLVPVLISFILDLVDIGDNGILNVFK